jgi:hypothetical protein
MYGKREGGNLYLVVIPPTGKVPIPQEQAYFLSTAQTEFPEDVLQVGLYRLIDYTEYPGDLIIALAQADQCQDLLLALAQRIPLDTGNCVPGDLSLSGIGPIGQDLLLRAALCLGALTEAGDESGIQREEARFFFPLFFQHVAKARWKEKHDGVIILEHKFLVNGSSIKHPTEAAWIWISAEECA